MENLQELIGVLAQPEVVARTASARAHRLCKICGNQATAFRTPRAELEYSISTICQNCQDRFLSSEPS
jgi:hypothetical protein